MTALPSAPSADDAAIAAALLAVAPQNLRGAVLRGPPGSARDAWLAGLAAAMPEARAPLRIPLSVSADQLSGGLDLALTLAGGRQIRRRGLLDDPRHGAVAIPMADRWSPPAMAAVVDSLEQRWSMMNDRGGGMTDGPIVLAFDEGREDDAPVHAALLDRLAFHVDLELAPPSAAHNPRDESIGQAAASASYFHVTISDEQLVCLAGCAAELGIMSSRADLFAASAARASAALGGRLCVDDQDMAVAVRLVLAPRARRLPSTSETEAQADPPDKQPRAADQDNDVSREQPAESSMLDEMDVASVLAALPPGLLQSILATHLAKRSGASGTGRGTGRAMKAKRGRPVGRKRGDPRRDGPLDLIGTIEAAAPWQIARARQAPTTDSRSRPRKLRISRDDVRVRRLKHAPPSTTIFAVDASGSSALHRMGEAKGAVELLLADCYVRRDEVALVAFRGSQAEVLLSPTRSLSRARRALTTLPGGGTTPLASGLDAARELSRIARRNGGSCLLVVLTDGRANVDSSGAVDRRAAATDALAAARRVRSERIAALLIDTSRRPGEAAAEVAREMNARYVPLPQAGAQQIFKVVRRAAAAVGS